MGWKDAFEFCIWVCAGVITLANFIVLFVKPVRTKVLGLKAEDDGIKCLLRSEMLKIYYANRDSKEIRQFEYENFCHLYKAYKAKGGNSFIDHIKEEMDEWEVNR